MNSTLLPSWRGTFTAHEPASYRRRTFRHIEVETVAPVAEAHRALSNRFSPLIRRAAGAVVDRWDECQRKRTSLRQAIAMITAAEKRRESVSGALRYLRSVLWQRYRADVRAYRGACHRLVALNATAAPTTRIAA